MDTRYDEALERARAGMPIDEVFPELKESEDEMIRKDICTWLKHKRETCTYPTPKKETLSTWIAYLERQKVQNPANATQTDANKNANEEWSMGDENALVFFHELISFGYTKMFCDAQTANDMRKMLNTWVESIRRPQSHWKPSEEQMSDLWLAATMNSFTCRTLKSLYNDLKKL